MAGERNTFDSGPHRAGRGWALVLAVVVVVIVTAVVTLVLGRRDAREGIDAVGPGDATQPIGTGGDDIEGPPPSVPGSPVANLFRDGSVAGSEGREIEVMVDASRLRAISFWVGNPPDQLLAVVGRDARSGTERQQAVPSAPALDASELQGRVTVRGTVERVPYPEATYSWALTRPEVDRLLDSGVYLRITSVGGAQEPAQAAPPREPPPASGAGPAGR